MGAIGARLGALVGGAILLMFMMQLTTQVTAYSFPEIFDLARGTGLGDPMGRLVLILIPIGYSLLTLGVAFTGTVASMFIQGSNIFTTVVSGVVFVIVGLGLLAPIGTYQDTASLALGGSNAGAYLTAKDGTTCAQTDATQAAVSVASDGDSHTLCIGSTKVKTGSFNKDAGTNITGADAIATAQSVHNDMAIARLVVAFYQVFFILSLAGGVFVGFTAGGGAPTRMGSLSRMGGGGR